MRNYNKKKSYKYKATIPGRAYFVTLTVVNWIDLFTRLEQRKILVDSLNYCSENKGLVVYCYCVMPSHVHMICEADDEDVLCNLMRDFKKFTAKKFIKTIREEKESRREWLLNMFRESCAHLKRNQTFKVWKTGYHAMWLYSDWFIRQKFEYIHLNPVKDEIVEFPWEYYYSSARDYKGRKGPS